MQISEKKKLIFLVINNLYLYICDAYKIINQHDYLAGITK